MNDNEWLWWCINCGHYTDKAPCEHCESGNEEILVLKPGQNPPRDSSNIEDYLCVEDYDWPESAYQ